MGCLQSSPEDGGDNKKLTQELRKSAKDDKYVKKLLFLGSGGSGKSTLFKQLRNIHGNGYSKEDRITFIDHIHAQIIEQMKLAIDCVETLAQEEYDKENDQKEDDKEYIVVENALSALSAEGQGAAAIVQSIKDPKVKSRLTDDITSAISLLWLESEIKKIYDLRAKFSIDDSTSYFWDAIARVTDNAYVPDDTDILLVRYRTTGVIEQKFTIKKNIFHIFDVGGQKSERKKWIHCFEHVTAVIFVASLSCFDEVMFEDEGVNSMVDSLQLFDNICNNTWFEKTSMILFLNKKDLFSAKIENGISINECSDFNDFDGDFDSFDETSAYIKQAFIEKNKSPDDKSIFTHLTCATDQNNVEKVFNDVQHIIIENSLMSAGLMGDFGSDDNIRYSDNADDAVEEDIR